MKTIRIDTNNQIAVLDIPSISSLSDSSMLGDSPEYVLPRRLPQPYSMFVDDCGLLKNLPVNPIGSYLYETDKHSSPIVGDIYLFKDGWGPDGFDSLGLSEEDISTLLPLAAGYGRPGGHGSPARRIEMLNDGYARAQFERDMQEPPAGNALTARMLETADRLKTTIRRLEHEREGIIGLHLRHLPNNLKAQVLEHYDSEIRNRRQELADIRTNLSAMGYIA